jgi:hypothetical protein
MFSISRMTNQTPTAIFKKLTNPHHEPLQAYICTYPERIPPHILALTKAIVSSKALTLLSRKTLAARKKFILSS